MAETWVTIEQVCRATSWTERHARRTAARHGWSTRISENRGRNGKREREYALSALPADAQVKLLQSDSSADGQIVVTPGAILEKKPETLPLFTASDSIAERIALNTADQVEVDRRLQILAPMIDFARRTNGHRPTIDVGGKKISNLNDLAEWVAAQHNVSTRSLWRWFGAWRKDGHAALARKIRKDHRTTRALGPAAQAFVQNKYCVEKLNRNHVFDVLRREWKRLKLGDGEAPSYATVRRYLDTIPVPVTTYCREGKEAFVTKCGPFVLRNAPRAMDWWISDHRCLDVFVRNTIFAQLRQNQMYRPWLTAVYDWGSRMLVGFAFSPSPFSGTIASALRMAARDFGFPEHLYWDNGKDYKKVKRGLEEIPIDAKIEDALRQVRVTSALPKHPRSKPIEAYFVRWSMRFDAIWGAAYAGNRPQNCRPECRLAQKQHEDFLNGRRRESPLPTDQDVFTAARQWILEYNYETPLDCLDGRVAANVFDEQCPKGVRNPASELQLSRLLSERDTCKIHAGGCLVLDRIDYEPDDQSFGALSVRQGQSLTILRDPFNLDDAIALDDRGIYVGRLRIKIPIEQDPDSNTTKEDVKAGIRREKSLRRACRQYPELLSRVAAAQGWKWESEQLLDRARAARTGTGTDDFAAIASVAPGARRALPTIKELPSSPFVSDQVRAFLAAEKEG